MNRILFFLFFFIFFTTNAHSNSKFDKDLKKVSVDNGFVDNTGTVYSEEQVSNKKDILLIIWTHGSGGDQQIDKCLKVWNLPPPAILNLHNQKIKNLEVKLYRLCAGVRGWTKTEQGKMWKTHEKTGNLDLKLVDKEGTPLIKKQKQIQKGKIIKKKVDKFIEQGFKNIVLAGHSSGGWQSMTVQSRSPKKIRGVIATQPGGGGTLKNRKDWPWWNDVRNYQISLMDLPNLNALIFTHDKDQFNSPEDYSFLSNINSVKFINLTSLGCKKKKILSGYHGIAKTKCFAEYEKKNKNIIKYLEEIF